MKKTSLALAIAFLVSLAAPAFAADGDRTLQHRSRQASGAMWVEKSEAPKALTGQPAVEQDEREKRMVPRGRSGYVRR